MSRYFGETTCFDNIYKVSDHISDRNLTETLIYAQNSHADNHDYLWIGNTKIYFRNPVGIELVYAKPMDLEKTVSDRDSIMFHRWLEVLQPQGSVTVGRFEYFFKTGFGVVNFHPNQNRTLLIRNHHNEGVLECPYQ